MALAISGVAADHPVLRLLGEETVSNFVQDYGGVEGRVLFSGGFSLIFSINDEWLLRVAILTGYPVVLSVASALINNFYYIMEIGKELLPEADRLEAHMVAAPEGKYHVFTVTRMRRIHAATPDEIVAVYGTHKAVLQALLQAGSALRQIGIIHRDISLGNILFDSATQRFVFIDADNACLLPASFTCTEGQGAYTPGYVHWESESRADIKGILQKLSTDVTGTGDALVNEPPMYAYSPLMLEHQMTHGLISTALAICFNTTPSTVYNLVAHANGTMRADADFAAWHYYLGMANTLNVEWRFTLDKALEATYNLSDMMPMHAALGGLLAPRKRRSTRQSSTRSSATQGRRSTRATQPSTYYTEFPTQAD